MKRERDITGQLQRHDDGDYESLLAEELLLQRARREAKAALDAEEEREVDFDALYLDRHGLDTLPEIPALIGGVLPRHAYGVLRGRDQSFKSFVALDWSLCLATGTPWQFRPTEHVRVLYIAGEGAYGLRKRVAAWEEANHLAPHPQAFVVRQTALNLHRPGRAYGHLLEHVAEGQYGLVVVDTLRRVAGSADGNSSEMGAVVDHLAEIREATAGGSVLVIAHTAKIDTDTRGYSGIEDDADVVWHARRDGDRVELDLTKMKDGPDGQTVTLQTRNVGESLVLVHSVPGLAGLTESEQQLLTVMREMFADTGASNTALMDASGLAKPTFYRARKRLTDLRLIHNTGVGNRPIWGLTSPVRPEGAPGLVSQAVLASETVSDLQESHESHAVSADPETVSTVSPPLGVRHETETETPLSECCPCGVPSALVSRMPQAPGCSVTATGAAS